MISSATAVLDWLHALGWPVKLGCLENNMQCLQDAETGFWAALRHLPRTEHISVGLVHET